MTTRHKDLKAGDLRHSVKVQRQTLIDDGSGGKDREWEDVSTIYCQVELSGGSEPYADSGAGRVRSKETATFRTWYRNDIKTTDRLFFDGKPWNIRNVDNQYFGNKFIELQAESGVEQ